MPALTPSAPVELTLCGIGVSPGLARGPVHLSSGAFGPPEFERIPKAAVPGELDRLRTALETTRRQIRTLQKQIDAGAGTAGADILDAHLLMLEDRSLLEEVESRIREGPQNAEDAFYRVMTRYIETLRQIGDEFLRERAIDIEDVARRVVRNLRGKEAVQAPVQPHILLAHELTPSETAAMDPRKVLGFATEGGSHTSHSAIMARSMGIPAVVGLPPEAVSRLHPGQPVLLDGYRGLLIVNPTKETLSRYEVTRKRKEALAGRLREMVNLPAETPDGQRIVLAANIEFEREMPTVREWGAEGVGLYRTEFLYLNRDTLPGEDEQAETYCRVAKAAGPDGVIVRTLDIGGDKLHALIGGGDESNPFLGWRGIRISLAQRGLFRTQLRAILRASAHGRVRIMFPMISGLQEIRSARAVLEECQAELTAEGIPWDTGIETGAMIEVPSAALTADILAREVDFFSVGTNDLIQYTIAVDRGNDRVASLYQPTHPAILRLLKHVAESARRHRIQAGVCGEMAADVQLTPLMTGLGFAELSMAATQLPAIKYAVRRLPADRCRRLLDEVMAMHDAEQIYEASRDLALEYYPELLA